MQADILEPQTNITSDPDTRSDCSSASAVRCDVEMDTSLINHLDVDDVGTHEGDDNNINECTLEDLDGTGSDYDNCRLLSPSSGDIPSDSTTWSPVTASPVEKPSQQTQPAETSAVDRRLPRLSSTLATSSDLSIRGYACGHQRCLINDLSAGVQFVTSKELSDHIRTVHNADEFPDHKPYRCGLPGCNKSWKSVNGLQYHLQVSKAHFLQAITSITSAVPSTGQPPASETSRKQKRPTRTHPCPHLNCPQVYKQLSGLRYHLSHGHSHKSPAQLDSVPPTLARKVTEKLQRQAANT